MAGSLVAKAEGEPALVQPPCRRNSPRCSGFLGWSCACPRTLSAIVRGGSPLGAAWSYVAGSDTVAAVSTLVVVLESVAMAAALAFGVWAARSRGAATKRIACVECAARRAAKRG